MGVFGAMITAVSGVRSQSYALENISGNIANSQTTGFKRVDTSFVDLVPDMPAQRDLAGSVLAYSRATNTLQGDLQTTGVATHMALNGQGYFMVSERTAVSGGVPTFGAQSYFTRRGDFQLDGAGYLVNGAGYYLQGTAIDPNTGATVGSSTSPIRISNDQIPARQTTAVDYRGNLPSTPQTNYANLQGTPTSELINPSTFTTDPVATGTVTANDSTNFLNQTLPAGSITVYNDLGAPVNVQMRWAKVSDDAYQPGPFGSAQDTWQLFYQSDAAATGTGVAWTRLGNNFTFSSSGQMTSAVTTTANVTVNGVTVNNVAFNFPGLTQFDDSNGTVTTTALNQDGYAAGQLDRIAVTADGRITGSYSNGQVAPLAQVAIAQFQADDMLKRTDGGVFEQTVESGAPVLGLQGASLVGGSLENSNTDIADEFSKMIITQQAYGANTRVISIAQQMLQDTINIVR